MLRCTSALKVEGALDGEGGDAGNDDRGEVDPELGGGAADSPQSPKAAATPTFAAAGIVVTEISTPISAPDFAVERERTPAMPASTATMTEKRSGVRDEQCRRMVAQFVGASVGGAEQERPEVGRGSRPGSRRRVR